MGLAPAAERNREALSCLIAICDLHDACDSADADRSGRIVRFAPASKASLMRTSRRSWLAICRACRSPGTRSSRENTKLQKPGEGAWQTATGIGSYKVIAADPSSGQVAFMGTLKEGDRDHDVRRAPEGRESPASPKARRSLRVSAWAAKAIWCRASWLLRGPNLASTLDASARSHATK